MFAALTFLVFLLCVCAGSVTVSPGEALTALRSALSGAGRDTAGRILLDVRLPRVLCAALTGAALSLCGASMQGLLRNPLAEGSTLGVSSGAALGAALAIATGFALPGLPGGGIMLSAMVFAFGSLLVILLLAYRLDYSMATNTIILLGVIFSMFATALISLVVTFSGDKARTILFWTMGSLSGSSYRNAAVLGAALLLAGGVIALHARELNAFAVGEENAAHVGVDVRGVKLRILTAAAALIGICVSVGGTISFVGLIIPHISRMLLGPNHHRLLPGAAFLGAVFLMLADLAARVILRPLELPIGVVTSLIGAVVFVMIFARTRALS